MDLVTFIPGIANSTTFSPGGTTPSPYNVNHTGLTDGTGPANSSANVAQIYNRLLLQIASTIDFSGLGIDNNNWAQLPYAVRKIAQDVVNSSLSGGVVTTAQYNNDFAFSHAQQGYQFLKNGLILQWGQTQAPGTFPASFNTTFPIAFPNAVFQVVGSPQGKSSYPTPLYENEVRLTNKTNTTATWLNAWIGDADGSAPLSDYSVIVYYIAIGR